MNFQDFFNPDRVVDLSFFNFENAIFENNPDVIVLSTPPISRFKDLEVCAKYKLPVLVEKPLAINFNEAKKLVKFMNDKIIHFTQIIFYLEDSIKEIFIDYIEEDSEFLSIDFSKVETDYWFCKLILKSKNIKQKFLKKINNFRKNFNLLNLKSCNDNNITINQIYFEEFENKDWLGENIQTLRPINIKNFIIYDNDNFKLFNPTKKLLKINSSSRNIDVGITRLRKKIEETPKNPKYLQTIRGEGYVLWIE